MIVETSSFGPYQTNVYVVGCSKTNQACVIDAPVDCLPFVNTCIKKHNLVITNILLTHAHIDHIAEVTKLKHHFDVPVYIHKLDGPALLHPLGKEWNSAFRFAEGMEADYFLGDGNLISVGQLSFQVLFTPGHSPGCVCFYEQEEQALFSGDTLFQGTMGRVDFPNSSPSCMWESLIKLSRLPSATRVFPGHGSATTIGKESWMQNAQSIFSEGDE